VAAFAAMFQSAPGT